jgi:hypothetical protein
MNEHEYFGLVDVNGKLMDHGLRGVPDLFPTSEIAAGMRWQFGTAVWRVTPVRFTVGPRVLAS